MVNHDAIFAAIGEVERSAALDDASSGLAMLAHEIRGRLHGLTLLAHDLRRHARDESSELSREWLLRNAERQAAVLHRLERVLNTVLGAYRATGGELRPVRAHVDLSEIARSAVSLELDTLRGAGCECLVEAPNPIHGRWDACQIELAIANLLSNAAKYGAGKPVEVGVFVRDGRAHVCVTDHGVGICAEDLPRLFRRFGRLGAAHGAEGIGLGLWFAKRVALAHDGDLNVVSAPSAGCSFTLQLPLTEN